MTSRLADFNQRRRDEWIASMARQLPPGTRILDIGAGSCRYRAHFAHCRYVTQDFGQYRGTPQGHLREEWSYGSIDYVCDAAAIPVPDGSFDAVLCTEVLEHVPEPIRVIAEIARVLRPGGRGFLSAPLGSGLHQQPYHFYGGYTPHFYQRFFPSLGCRILSIEPNGRFFRLLLQEMHRAVDILRREGPYGRLHPIRWLLRLLDSEAVARWMTRLDDRIPVDEFTVGYHVVIQKGEASR